MNNGDGADDSQVQSLTQRKPPGRETGMLAAVIERDDRLSAAAKPGDSAESEKSDRALQLAQDLRAADPSFTREEFVARAAGAKIAAQAPAPAVVRKRRSRWWAMAGTAFMLIVTVVGVARLLTGLWPWRLWLL